MDHKKSIPLLQDDDKKKKIRLKRVQEKAGDGSNDIKLVFAKGMVKKSQEGKCTVKEFHIHLSEPY